MSKHLFNWIMIHEKTLHAVCHRFVTGVINSGLHMYSVYIYICMIFGTSYARVLSKIEKDFSEEVFWGRCKKYVIDLRRGRGILSCPC